MLMVSHYSQLILEVIGNLSAGNPARPAEAWPWMTGPGNARAPHLGGGHYVLRAPLSTIRELGRDYREGGFRARRHSPFMRA